MDMQNLQKDGINRWTLQQELTPNKEKGNICLLCAKQGRTCCQGHDIYVTPGDCERIRSHSGMADFFEFRGCSQPAYAEQDGDPLWRQYVFRRNGRRRVLKRRDRDNCLFLGPEGCSLPLTARPLVCRLYPHLYSAVGIAAAWDCECPAIQKEAGLMIEEGIAGVGWHEAVQWHRMLYSEILGEVNTDDLQID